MKFENIFKTELGERLYSEAEKAVFEFSMNEKISYGVLVGFSGGADSLFLLLFLLEYKRRQRLDFKIRAVHINHSIRGNEAYRDAEFSRNTAEELGVEFSLVKLDIPSYAEKMSLGTEEAARKLRYETFNEIIKSDNFISYIAVAHNAGDNFETMLFNIARGTGLKGLCGIPPVRDNIVRPIITVSKDDILQLFSENNIEYVTDSTNLSIDYTRNYIRHEIVPKFERLSDSYEKASIRLASILRNNDDFIERCAVDYINNNLINNRFDVKSLSALHSALLSRVLSTYFKKNGITNIEYTHIKKITELLSAKENFKVSLPNDFAFVLERGKAYVDVKHKQTSFFQKLELGFNKVNGFSDIIYISREKADKTSLNVYKIAIHAKLKFDIINDVLYVRSKNDGDAYKYGGMTRKLKKLFNDREIPPSVRTTVPVFQDSEGIIWVPGYGVAKRSADKEVYVYILENPSNAAGAHFYIPKNN